MLEKENRIERVEIFESLFDISKRLNKKVYLYGLNEDTKRAVIFLTAFDVSVKGFLLTKEQNELNGMFYLGCPAISFSEFEEIENDSIVLDVYGNNISEIEKELRTVPHENIQVLFETKEKHICIYGAGESGRCLYRLLRSSGINIDFFCDKNGDKIAEVDKCPVIRPEQLEDIDRDCFIIVAIDDWTVAQEVQKMLLGKMFLKVDLFDSLFWKLKFTEEVWQKGEVYLPVFRPQGIYYLYRILSKKKVYFFSNNVQYLVDTVSTLKKVGVVIQQSVSLAVDNGMTINGLLILNAYQLVYEDLSNCLIWVLTGEEENAKNFMYKSGIRREIFVYSSGGPLSLNRSYILDTHLGYMDSRGSIVRRNCADDEKVVKVGILGGSTSDYDLYAVEKSWPKCFLELAERNGIKMECICAATAGNTSAMEHIRLIRDLIWKKPDVIISYSRINEISHAVNNHRFAHIYQKDIFDKLAHTETVDSFFSLKRGEWYYMGETVSDPASVWLGNERMMHAVCEEFHIPFFTFLQPFLCEKKPKKLVDLEVEEHVMSEIKKVSGTSALGEQVKKDIDAYSWLYDLTNIFDEIQEEIYFDVCHVFERGNKMIAEKIFSCISDVLISQKEQKINGDNKLW